MNILAAVEKRPGRSRISLDSITVSIIIKRISNFHQLSLIVIWYDVHYVITLPLHYITPLHLWWYQGWFSMRPGDWRDPDFWFWSNLDITLLTPHSLPHRDITTCWSGNNRGNSSSTSQSKTWAVQREASCLFSLANTGRTNWCLKVSWITGEREQDAGIGM